MALIRRPSAYFPLAVSFCALAMIVCYAALYGMTPHPEERAPARIFQLLMLLQVPVILFFAMHWLPRYPRQAAVILALQGLSWLTPVALILWLER